MPELIVVNMNSLYRPVIIRSPGTSLNRRGGLSQLPITDNEAYHVVYHGADERCNVLIIEAKRDMWDEHIFGPRDTLAIDGASDPMQAQASQTTL